MPDSPTSANRLPTELVSYLVLAATLGLSVLAWHMAERQHDAHQRGHFDAAVQVTEAEIRQRMQHYADILKSLRSLFYASHHVTSEEFQTFIDSSYIPQRYPGVQAIGYIRHPTWQDTPPSTQNLRQVQMEIPCGDPDSSISPRGERPEYHIVPFVEHMARNVKLLGEDIMLDPACRDAMERARDSGKATLSGLIRLQRGDTSFSGFSLILPLYESGPLLEADLGKRRESLVGFIFASFVTPELFRGIFGGRVLTDIDFEVFAAADLAPESLLYDDDNVMHAANASYPAAYHETRQLELFGSTWYMYYSALRGFHHPFAHHVPPLILIAGVVTSLLLFGLTRSQIRSVRQKLGYAHDLEFRATHDSLTHLPNRSALHARLGQLLGNGGQPFALLMLDLDGFKEINDTLGHHSGDLLLRRLGPRMLDAMGPGDLLVRLGGDEFAIVIASVTSVAGIMKRAEHLLEILRRPFELDDIEVKVDASIGIALAPDHGQDSSVLLRHADVAMYSAKRRNLNVVLYDPELDEHSPRRLSLVSELAHAIAEDQLELHYQPKVRLQDNRCTGLEALVRWNHPRDGLLMPGAFVPQAENSSIIQPLTDWIIESAIRQCRTWHQQGLDIEVAINVSARNLMDPDLPERVAELLRSLEFPAHYIEFEVTESAIIADPERAYQTLSSLHALGIKISIDDFGTGYTSMGHLKRLPVSSLKIDRSFVSNMESDENDALIVNTVAGLAHDLGMTVVAEGVEDGETLLTLKVIRCDFAQGFHICRPLPVENITEWLQR